MCCSNSKGVCLQGKRKCSCKQNYIGDGVVCELKQRPISRCLQDNGGCHPDAQCSDLHFEGKTFKDGGKSSAGPTGACVYSVTERAVVTHLLSHVDTQLGVFHQRSDKGQYKLNYTAAQQACSAHGGTMATYNQLSYAQQVSERNTSYLHPQENVDPSVT